MLTCSFSESIARGLDWRCWIGIECEKMLLWWEVMWS